MPRLLFVAYHYPPSVDAGAKRALGFHRHLAEHGWETTVLTVRDGNYATAGDDGWIDGKDVVRVTEECFPWQRGAPAGRAESAASAAPTAGVLRRFVRAALYVPDPWRGFHRPAYRAAVRLHRNEPFDVVLTTSAPWTSLGVGAALAGTGLPWVADLRDLWLRNQYGYPYGALRRGVDERLERSWLASAAAITTTTEGQARIVRDDRFGPPVHTVRNGFLESASPDLPPREDDDFRIVFAGKLYAHSEHSAEPFLDVLARWRDTDGEAFGRVRAEFYGRADGGFDASVRARGLEGAVRFRGLVPRDRAQRAIEDADVALVLVPPSHREVVVTKVYDALGALTPILLLGPPSGEAADVVTGAEGGGAFAPDDTDGALAWLRERAARGRDSVADRRLRAERVAPYAYASLAGELASVLDGAIR